MDLQVQKTDRLGGEISIPGSKSHAVRALFFAALAEIHGGNCTLTNLPNSEDIEDAKRVTDTLKKALRGSVGRIHTGNSGLTNRFLLPLLGLRENPEKIEIIMGAQMKNRPMQPLADALSQLGMRIDWPFVSGRLTGGGDKEHPVEVDGTSSQYLSALLIALPLAEKDSQITVRDLKERPYVEMTLAWLDELGIQYKHEQNESDTPNTTDTFYIKGSQKYPSFQKEIPGDFSSAAVFLAAGTLIPGEIDIHGLDPEDQQADKQLIELLKEHLNYTISTCKVWVNPQSQPVERTNRQILTCKFLPRKEFKPVNSSLGRNDKANDLSKLNLSDCPDLLPIMAVVATQTEGETRLTAPQARIKESDRIAAMAEELKKMGAEISEFPDGLIINGGATTNGGASSRLRGARLSSHGDHRVAMALTLAGLLADGKTVIEGAECVSKTYPNFVSDMRKIGAKVNRTRAHTVIIGFKSVGKTTFGRKLAKECGLPFVDLDEEIEKHEGRTCPEIASESGEDYFRSIESKILKKLLGTDEPCVLAVGGGTPIAADNRELLRKFRCIWLRADREEVFARIPKTFFPGKDLKELWNERKQVYKGLADEIINL